MRKSTFAKVAFLTAASVVLSGQALAAKKCDAPSSYADLAERLSPAVVNISTSQGGAARSGTDLGPLQRKFNRPAVSLGSGFVIDASGIVVTNNHVIDNADAITVTLNDGREFSAEVAGKDRETDLAVLKLKTSGARLPNVDFGGLDCARVGDVVLAIGNPFGLGGTVTTGIVSARNRDINSGQYDDYIQTDAAINRGNSGGPLFDMQGNVIGINTAIYSQTGGSVGVGFAVPADLASPIIDQLLEFGETRRGWLGVSIDDLTPDLASTMKVSVSEGAVVTVVRPNSPASDAGVEPNDVILKFDTRTVGSVKDLTRAVAETQVGARVPMVVLRDGKRMTLTVQVDRRETRLLAGNLNAPLPANAARGSGLTLQEPTDDVLQAYGLPANSSGVVVTAVDPDSPAAIILQPGDIILEIGWERVSRAGAAVDKLGKLRNLNSGPVQIYVQRGDLLFYEQLRP